MSVSILFFLTDSRDFGGGTKPSSPLHLMKITKI